MTQQSTKPSFLRKLQTKWGVNSLFQVVLILLTFAFTGLTVMFIKNPLLNFLSIDMSTGGFWKSFLYFVFVLPVYQVILLFYGTLLGQFSFFWEKEKQLVRLFSRNRAKK